MKIPRCGMLDYICKSSKLLQWLILPNMSYRLDKLARIMQDASHVVDHKAVLQAEDSLPSGDEKLEEDMPADPTPAAGPPDAPSASKPGTSNAALEAGHLSEQDAGHEEQSAHAAEDPSSKQSEEPVLPPQHRD